MLILTLIRPLGGVEVLCHESLFSAPTLKETAGEAHLGPFPGSGPPGGSQGFPWAGVLAPPPFLGEPSPRGCAGVWASFHLFAILQKLGVKVEFQRDGILKRQ